jgi:integrase
LRNRPLRDGARLAGTARFGDGTWVLTPAVHQQHQPAVKLDFATIPVPFRDAAKEVFYALLAGEAPAGQGTRSIATIRVMFSAARHFLCWASDQDITSLAGFTVQNARDYHAHVTAQRFSGGNLHNKWNAACLFWSCRAALSTGALPFDPGSVTTGPPGSGRRIRAENTTSRFPEQVIAPLLTWALWWIDEASGDILRGCGEWAGLNAHTRGNRTRRGEAPARDIATQLAGVLGSYRATRRPLPSAGGRVNIRHLALETGCSPAGLQAASHLTVIGDAVRDCGLADSTYLRTPPAARLSGSLWLPALRYQDLPHYVRLLRAAAYVTIAYLSGMRDSEVKHLQRGCLQAWRDEAGSIVRRKITSLAFKDEEETAGAEATWIVTEPVARAVAVLEALHDPSQAYLFAIPPTSQHYRRAVSNAAITTKTTTRDLAAFITWINGYCRQHQRPDNIPPGSGGQWQPSTRQFRRTLAWFIARQPGGTIAGALQYRHVQVRVFEGYAGTSASGFRAEVEAEQALARGEKLSDLATACDSHRLAGPAAAEAGARLAEFERHLQFTGKIITDRSRLARHMTRHDPHIYPGEFVTCVYDPDKALCRRSDSQHGPSLPDCQPLKCRNVTLTAGNTQALTGHLGTLDTALASSLVLAPYLRHRLQQRRDDIASFLATHSTLPASEQPGA